MKTLIATACFALSGTAWADARIAYAVEGSCTAPAESIEISGSRMRIDMRLDGLVMSSLFDGEEDTVTSLMHDQKQFHETEVDEDAADYTADVMGSTMTYVDRQMDAAMAQMKKNCDQMKAQAKGRAYSNPCDNMQNFRSMMESAMGPANQAKPELRETSREDSIGNSTCRWTEVWQGDRKLREQCDAEIAGLPLPDSDRGGFARGMRVLLSYGDAMKPAVDRFAAANPNPVPVPPKGKMTLAGRCFDANGDRVGQFTASVAAGPVDPARFQVPPDYTSMMQATPQ